MGNYLIESALLTHGLPGITEEMLLEAWQQKDAQIVWMEEGRPVLGTIEAFCEFRRAAASYGRIHYQIYDQAAKEGRTGALTASGTMKVCETLGIPWAVSCGIGGLARGDDPKGCHDLEALEVSPVSLAATAPKDMFDAEVTIRAMQEVGILVLGDPEAVCDGYLFLTKQVELAGLAEEKRPGEPVLVLRGIPREFRIQERSILEEACAYGNEQKAQGGLYHPAVNQKLSLMTGGRSSKIQLASLIDNIRWVEAQCKISGNL